MLKDIITNPILIASALAWVISQIVKGVIDHRAHRSVRVLGHGGMPSSHSATVSALALAAGLFSGFGSAAFAIAAMVAFVVMSDAAGVRNETAKHSASIKELAGIVNEMNEAESDEVKTDKLEEFIGHTPLQVIIGAALGLAVALAVYFIMKFGFNVAFYY